MQWPKSFHKLSLVNLYLPLSYNIPSLKQTWIKECFTLKNQLKAACKSCFSILRIFLLEKTFIWTNWFTFNTRNCVVPLAFGENVKTIYRQTDGQTTGQTFGKWTTDNIWSEKNPTSGFSSHQLISCKLKIIFYIYV